MSIVVRPFEQRDIDSLLEMEQRLFSLPWSRTDFENLLTRDYCHYLVAEEEGSAVGFLGMTLLCGEGDVDKVMVLPEKQGKGICQEMFLGLFALGESLGAEAYTLEVRVSNQRAIHVYEKMGFAGEGIRPGFYEKPKEDALIMWKRR